MMFLLFRIFITDCYNQYSYFTVMVNVCLLSAFISTGQIMGWGHKAIEIRSAETGHLDGVFMHKKAQKLKFLCERNDKVCQLQLLSGMRILWINNLHSRKLILHIDSSQSQLFVEISTWKIS